jgi:hypothetical protein
MNPLFEKFGKAFIWFAFVCSLAFYLFAMFLRFCHGLFILTD